MLTGRWNADIKQWLADQEQPKVSTNRDCPECEGKGYDLQFLYETNYARPCSRCRPAQRADAERAQLKGAAEAAERVQRVAAKWVRLKSNTA